METTNNTSIVIADSSALVSLVIPSDTRHLEASRILEASSRAGVAILIPSEVFSETINLLGKKFGHARAVEAAELLLRSAIFEVSPTTPLVRTDALNRFRHLAAGVSYTDCLVMAYASVRDTTAVFGFDEVFRQNGYVLPTYPREEAA